MALDQTNRYVDLTLDEQEHVFPLNHRQESMGITGFTLPTMYRWVTSERGREMTMHPFQKGHFLGSGQAEMVIREAGLDGKSQLLGGFAVRCLCGDLSVAIDGQRTADTLATLPGPGVQPTDVADADHGHLVQPREVGVGVPPDVPVRFVVVIVFGGHGPGAR